MRIYEKETDRHREKELKRENKHKNMLSMFFSPRFAHVIDTFKRKDFYTYLHMFPYMNRKSCRLNVFDNCFNDSFHLF